MPQGKHTTRLRKIEQRVSEGGPEYPSVLARNERWPFMWELVNLVHDRRHAEAHRRYAEVERLDRHILQNHLWVVEKFQIDDETRQNVVATREFFGFTDNDPIYLSNRQIRFD